MVQPRALRDSTLSIPAGLLENRKRLRWLAVVGALVVVALVAYAIAMRTGGVQGTDYRMLPVERRTVIQTVDATGTLDVAVRIDVPAPVIGRLETIEVVPGAKVARGQVLARLAEETAVTQLRGALAELSAAGSHVEEALANLMAVAERRKRVESLSEHGLSSRREVDAARAEEARAKAAMQAAEAEKKVASEKVRASREQQQLRTMVAPIDGVVVEAPDHSGAIVTPQQESLFVLGSSLDAMRIDAEVAEADIGAIEPGQHAEFTVPAFPGRTFAAKVDSVQLQGRKEGAAVIYSVALSAQNSDHVLLPGMTATVKVKVARAENVLAVREVALRFTPEDAPEAPARSRVWRRQGSKIVAVPVVPGLSDGVFTEIRPQDAALRPGDEVIVGLAYQATNAGRGSPGITLRRRQ